MYALLSAANVALCGPPALPLLINYKSGFSFSDWLVIPVKLKAVTSEEVSTDASPKACHLCYVLGL